MTKHIVSARHRTESRPHIDYVVEVHASPGKIGHCYVTHDELGCSRDYKGTAMHAISLFFAEHSLHVFGVSPA